MLPSREAHLLETCFMACRMTIESDNAVDMLFESQGGQIGPVHSHGTQTTGCAAASGNNGVGVSGVGWNLSHRMLRVSNSTSGGTTLSVLQHAARTSIQNGDRVASVSYSGVDNASNLTTATYIKSIGGLLSGRPATMPATSPLATATPTTSSSSAPLIHSITRRRFRPTGPSST